MKRFLRAVVMLPMLLATCDCPAAVFERDWKVPGDGLLTYDDESHREWLDLSETLLEQFSGSDLEQRYQNAIAELAPGGRFEGFLVARRSDVLALADSAGVDALSDDFDTNHFAVGHLTDLLGPTLYVENRLQYSLGYLDERVSLGSGIMTRLISVFGVELPGPFNNGDASLRFGPIGDSAEPSTVGVMVYRVVPEPSSFIAVIWMQWLVLCSAWRCLRHLSNV